MLQNTPSTDVHASFGVGSAVYARTSCVLAHEALVYSVLLAPLSTYVASTLAKERTVAPAA